MFEHIEQFLAGLERADQWKEDRKIAVPPQGCALESVKEGDIYVASWGWEQTNIDATKSSLRRVRLSLCVRLRLPLSRVLRVS